MQASPTLDNDELNQGGSMSAALRKENGHGYEIVPPIPKPEENIEGKLYDPQGKTVKPATSTIMGRIDAKGSEDVTLKKSTLWLLGAGVIILQLVFNYGGSMISWARDDESQKKDLIRMQSEAGIITTQTQNDIKRIHDAQERLDSKFEKLNDRLLEQQRFIDRMSVVNGLKEQ